MHLFFGDDSRQIRPTRSKMGPLVAAGGFLVEGKVVKSLERSLNDVCHKAGFPANDEFKWSPGRELWMRTNLIGDARRDFYFDVLSTAADHEIVAMVVLEDVKCRTATRAKAHEDDVIYGTVRNSDAGFLVPDDLSDFEPQVMEGRYPAAQWVLKAQFDAQKAIPNSKMVILRDIEKHPANVHYNTAGQLKVGKLFAEAFLEYASGAEAGPREQ